MLNALSHSNIVDLSVVTVTQHSRLGRLTRTISGEQVLARARSLDARISFLYKLKEITRFSSWISLQPAIGEAKRIAWQLGVSHQEPGTIVVDVHIKETSYALVEPNSHRISLYALGDDELQRAINKIAGHEPIETKYSAVWSSDSSEAANARRCNEVLDAFRLNARPQYDCISDAEKLFAQLRRQIA